MKNEIREWKSRVENREWKVESGKSGVESREWKSRVESRECKIESENRELIES